MIRSWSTAACATSDRAPSRRRARTGSARAGSIAVDREAARAAASGPSRAPCRPPPWRTSSAAATPRGARPGAARSSSRSSVANASSAKPSRARRSARRRSRRGLRGAASSATAQPRVCASETTGAARARPRASGRRRPGVPLVRADLDVGRQELEAVVRATSRCTPPSRPCAPPSHSSCARLGEPAARGTGRARAGRGRDAAHTRFQSAASAASRASSRRHCERPLGAEARPAARPLARDRRPLGDARQRRNCSGTSKRLSSQPVSRIHARRPASITSMSERTSWSPSSSIAAEQVSASPVGRRRPVDVERVEAEREDDAAALEVLGGPEADHLAGRVEHDRVEHEARARPCCGAARRERQHLELGAAPAGPGLRRSRDALPAAARGTSPRRRGCSGVHRDGRAPLAAASPAAPELGIVARRAARSPRPRASAPCRRGASARSTASRGRARGRPSAARRRGVTSSVCGSSSQASQRWARTSRRPVTTQVRARGSRGLGQDLEAHRQRHHDRAPSSAGSVAETVPAERVVAQVDVLARVEDPAGDERLAGRPRRRRAEQRAARGSTHGVAPPR